jgi:hypothetical protein
MLKQRNTITTNQNVPNTVTAQSMFPGQCGYVDGQPVMRIYGDKTYLVKLSDGDTYTSPNLLVTTFPIGTTISITTGE